MTTAIRTTEQQNVLAKIALTGDLSSLNDAEKWAYYCAVCDSVGLSPVTRPFDLLKDKQSGEIRLYPNKRATDGLQKNHKLSVAILERRVVDGCYEVEAEVRSPDGRSVRNVGVAWVGKLEGEARANAMMKATTKAIRRATLAFGGLGLPDESEIETVPNMQRVEFTAPSEAIAAPATIHQVTQSEEVQVETPVEVQADPDAIARKAIEIVTTHYVSLDLETKAKFETNLNKRFGVTNPDNLTVPQIVELATIIKDHQTKGKAK